MKMGMMFSVKTTLTMMTDGTAFEKWMMGKEAL